MRDKHSDKASGQETSEAGQEREEQRVRQEAGESEEAQGADFFRTGAAPGAAMELPAAWVAPEPGLILMRRYRLLERLGEGGMGQVFLAEDMELEEQCALKVIHPRLAQDEALRKRFLQELKLTRRLTHPGIVRTHALQREPETGRVFFTMEHLEGQTLQALFEEAVGSGKEPPFDLSFVVRVVSRLAEILDYAHSKGVIHRDLKPANVMVLETGEIKLMDFGIAKWLWNPGAALETGPVGTPAYIPPEQLRAESEPTPATDVYALGVMSYHLLTGRLPRGRVLPPSKYNAKIPRGVDDAIFASMEDDPLERPRTPGAFAQALERAARGASSTDALRQGATSHKRAHSVSSKRKESSRRPAASWSEVQRGIELYRPEWLASNARHASLQAAPGPQQGGCLAQVPALAIHFERKVILAQDSTPLLEMVRIPGGDFLMGAAPNDPFLSDLWVRNTEVPQREVFMDAYWIARHPVTNRQWHKFLEESGYQAQHDREEKFLRHWQGEAPPEELDAHPVVYINYMDAWAFCDFYGLMLPTEAQWEKAARGDAGQSWPWGNTPPTRELCNFHEPEGSTSAVGDHPAGSSPYGLLDCAGNVWEWCADAWKKDALAQMKAHTKNVAFLAKKRMDTYACRGGGFSNNARYMRCSYRNQSRPTLRLNRVGFRPAQPCPK